MTPTTKFYSGQQATAENLNIPLAEIDANFALLEISDGSLSENISETSATVSEIVEDVSEINETISEIQGDIALVKGSVNRLPKFLYVASDEISIPAGTKIVSQNGNEIYDFLADESVTLTGNIAKNFPDNELMSRLLFLWVGKDGENNRKVVLSHQYLVDSEPDFPPLTPPVSPYFYFDPYNYDVPLNAQVTITAKRVGNLNSTPTVTLVSSDPAKVSVVSPAAKIWSAFQNVQTYTVLGNAAGDVNLTLTGIDVTQYRECKAGVTTVANPLIYPGDLDPGIYDNDGNLLTDVALFPFAVALSSAGDIIKFDIIGNVCRYTDSLALNANDKTLCFSGTCPTTPTLMTNLRRLCPLGTIARIVCKSDYATATAVLPYIYTGQVTTQVRPCGFWHWNVNGKSCLFGDFELDVDSRYFAASLAFTGSFFAVVSYTAR